MLNLMPKEGLREPPSSPIVWPTKKSGDLEARWKQRSNLPWMTFDPAFGYGHVYVLKEASRTGGSTDRNKIADALHSMKIESGPAVAALNGTVQFDAKGTRVNPARGTAAMAERRAGRGLSGGCRDRRNR
jgi:ABC-type branched-subunit amino acid transport system substrate-binding protein